MIPPINILDIINEQNGDIPYYIINNFIQKSLQYEVKSIELKQNEYHKNEERINETINDIRELNTKSYSFNIYICKECGLNLEMPIIAFKCGHAYHKECINMEKVENKKLKCPGCLEEKIKITNELKNYDEFYKSINNIDKLEKEVEKNANKIDFIYELYGKKLLDLGQIITSK